MILVVGGSGRLGRMVVVALAAQHEVRVLSRHATTTRPSMSGFAHLVDGDVRDPTAVAAAAEQASCIVIASHGVESRDRDGLESVDLGGARAVAAAAQQVGCRIVLVSIAGAGADAALPLARTKFAAEQSIRESGLPSTIIRAAAFAQTWAMILTQSAARTGRPGIIGPGRATHRFVDVRDVSDAVTRAATDASLRGRTLEVCGPDELTVVQLAAMVQEANGWTGAPRHLPVPLARAIGSCLGLFRPDLGRRLSLGIGMNQSQQAGDGTLEVPDWLVTHPITVETIREASATALNRGR